MLSQMITLTIVATFFWYYFSHSRNHYPKMSTNELLCGSRKYPYPPPPQRKTIGNSEGEGGFKGSNFRGVGGVHGKLFSKG